MAKFREGTILREASDAAKALDDFQREIKAKRSWSGYESTQKFAYAVDLTPPTVSKYQNYPTMIRMDVMQKIVKVLKPDIGIMLRFLGYSDTEMANLTDSSALSALNEKDYINKLYDSNTDTTKKLLQDNYTQNEGLLNTEKQNVQNQTTANVDRTNVEAQQSKNSYTGPKLTLGASAQESLSRGNAQQSNVTSLNQKQAEADAEIERQRQLLGSQYAAAIKKAQADNDMERAQQLYDAAKDEEEKLLELRTTASSLLADKGDTSIRDALLNGETPSPDYSGETWEQVLKNEDSINSIYDNKLQSKLLELQMEQEQAASDLAAKRSKQSAETDSKLTDAYVEALQKAKNYAEVQTAYGQGSGTAAAARTAQDTEMQKELTRFRGRQYPVRQLRPGKGPAGSSGEGRGKPLQHPAYPWPADGKEQ